MDALRLSGLRVGYHGRDDVLHGIDLVLEPGGSAAIMGPSGGGKSTLLKTVAGLVQPRGGTVDVLGHRLPTRPPKGSVGYVPQRLGLVRHTSVLDNVLHGSLHQATPWQSILHRAPAGAVERAWEALDQVGLEDKAHDAIHRLSGGQQRRVAVARTLVQRPRLLLADEFLGELDDRTATTVAQAVDRLRREAGTTVLVVEHRAEHAMRVASRIYRLDGGALIPWGGEA